MTLELSIFRKALWTSSFLEHCLLTHNTAERVQQVSGDVLRIQQSSLYPALHRLERRGVIKAKWGASENNRRAKFYELTRTGQKQLATKQDSWAKLTEAVAQVLRAV